MMRRSLALFTSISGRREGRGGFSQGDMSVMLICDADRVFGNNVSNAGLRVVFPNDADPSRLVVLAATGEQAALDMTRGGANQQFVDAEEWDKMIAILRAGGDFAFVTSEDAVQLEDVIPLPDLRC